jgi:predicted nucleotidyltransferase
MIYGLDDDDIRKINAVFSSHSAVQEVIIFGSRAIGNYKPGSDVDLVVKGENLKHSDLLNLSVELDDLGALYTFDVQHYDAIRDADVLDHINRAGKQFYVKE